MRRRRFTPTLGDSRLEPRRLPSVAPPPPVDVMEPGYTPPDPGSTSPPGDWPAPKPGLC
jgi:hypothetical protein